MDRFPDVSLLDTFPYASRINTNYVPTEHESDIIKRFLQRPIKAANQMKRDIADLQATLDAMREKHNKLVHEVRLCKALVAGARRLPFEVLSKIFCHSLTTDRNPPMDYDAPPLVFTRVCKQWREIALSTKQLWSAIHVNVIAKPDFGDEEDEDDEEDEEDAEVSPWDRQRAQVVTDWLRRSGSLSLRVSICSQDECAALLDLYIGAIRPVINRVESLYIQAVSSSVFRLGDLRANDLPRLKSLFLLLSDKNSTRSEKGNDHLIPTWKKHGNLLLAPSLTKLFIETDLIDLPKLNVAWSQLTHLNLSNPHSSWSFWSSRPKFRLRVVGLSHLLQHCSLLVYCKLEVEAELEEESDSDDWYAPTNAPPPPQPVSMHLPALLTLEITTSSDIGPFLKKLEVPSLQELGVHIHGKEIDTWDCLRSLLEPGNIQKLDIELLSTPQEVLIQCLKRCRRLTSLRITQSSQCGSTVWEGDQEGPFEITDELLSLLGAGGEDGLCPLLDEFACADDVIKFSTAGLLNFVHRKQGGHGDIPGLAKLRNVQIKDARPTRKRVDLGKCANELREYIRAGLRFCKAKSRRQEVFYTYRITDGFGGIEVTYGSSELQYNERWM